MTKTIIIAEIGTTHQGNLEMALALVRAAKASGATVAKFQAVFADEIVHPRSGLVPLTRGKVALYDRFKALEQPPSFYEKLKKMTEAEGLSFLCTPFGLKSFNILKNLNVSSYKIASPELNHYPLIDAVANEGRPMFLSLGVSMLADIEEAVNLIANRADTTLLQCVTAYPAPPEDYNLSLLPLLKKLIKVKVGVSDHSMDPVLVPSLAIYCGASVVEKHICLSRTNDGLDDPIALEPAAFCAMVEAIKLMETEPEQAMQNLINSYGQVTIDAVLGDGHKRLAASEIANYGRTNRSIAAITNLQAGECISSENSALYRAEKELKPGLNPKMWPVIMGRRLSKAVKAGDGIVWDDLLN